MSGTLRGNLAIFDEATMFAIFDAVDDFDERVRFALTCRVDLRAILQRYSPLCENALAAATHGSRVAFDRFVRDDTDLVKCLKLACRAGSLRLIQRILYLDASTVPVAAYYICRMGVPNAIYATRQIAPAQMALIEWLSEKYGNAISCGLCAAGIAGNALLVEVLLKHDPSIDRAVDALSGLLRGGHFKLADMFFEQHKADIEASADYEYALCELGRFCEHRCRAPKFDLASYIKWLTRLTARPDVWISALACTCRWKPTPRCTAECAATKIKSIEQLLATGRVNNVTSALFEAIQSNNVDAIRILSRFCEDRDEAHSITFAGAISIAHTGPAELITEQFSAYADTMFLEACARQDVSVVVAILAILTDADAFVRGFYHACNFGRNIAIIDAIVRDAARFGSGDTVSYGHAMNIASRTGQRRLARCIARRGVLSAEELRSATELAKDCGFDDLLGP